MNAALVFFLFFLLPTVYASSSQNFNVTGNVVVQVVNIPQPSGPGGRPSGYSVELKEAIIKNYVIGDGICDVELGETALISDDCKPKEKPQNELLIILTGLIYLGSRLLKKQ